MRVLITGGSGFIGSHVVDKLIENEYDVRILDLETPYLDNVDFIKGSILDSDTVFKATLDIDIIFHFAGFSNVDKVHDDPLGTIKSNILGTATILDNARIQGIHRVVLASSVFLYDNCEHLYTYSKQVSEKLCIYYQKSFGLPYTIMRLSTAYGPRSRGEDVISIFVRQSLTGGQIVVKNNGKQIRNFIYVEDLAEACVKVLSKNCINKILTIAGYEPLNIYDLSILIKNLCNEKVNIKLEKSNERYYDYSGEIENIDESYKMLNWKPAVNLEMGIKKYIKWSKNHLL